MGCDIHIFIEVKRNGKWLKFEDDHFTLDDYDKKEYKKDKGGTPFDWRSYSMFGFLADIRNYSNCIPLSKPKGLPNDSEYLNEDGYYSGSGWGMNNTSKKEDLERDYDYHSFSYLTLRELSEFDYEKTFLDERPQTDTYGKIITYREHLGGMFFVHLEELKTLGEPDDIRIVFWFDN